MHVLLSAYVCKPGAGSEPEIGWTTLRAAAASHEVVLLTQPINAPFVASGLEQEGIDSVEIVEVPDPAWLRRYEGRLGLGHLAYAIWQYRALRAARRLEERVDVAHHITFGGDWFPCAVHFLRRVPVVWGPVGGYAPVPWRLVRYLSVRGFAIELAREALTRPLRALCASLARRRGLLVVAHNRDTARRFERAGAKVAIKPLVAMPPLEESVVEADEDSQPARDGERRAVFISRLVPWKGPLLALRALAGLPADWRLDFYGRGPAEGRIRRLAERLGIGERVHLRGFVDRDEIWRVLGSADVLVFPSMHDSAPQPVAQAVRAGCPVVCLDVAGPPLLVEGTTGIAVEPDRKAAERVAEAVARVRRHPPSDRWSSERLPATLTQLYDQAVGIDVPVGAEVAGG